MKRAALVATLLLLLPVGALAAFPSTFSAAHSTLVASSAPGNAYASGATVTLTAPVAGDFSSAAGSVIIAAPISGDALLIAGTAETRAPVTGDVRALGGSLSFDEPVGGDLVAAGISVLDRARPAGSVFIAASDAQVLSGAGGAVTIYGSKVMLAGDFANDVKVVTSGRLTLAPDTSIRGKLSYDAPEPADIPSSAKITGGVVYTNASYLPNANASRALAFASIGIFLLARILGALIIAGLLAGLFPRLAEAVTERAVRRKSRSIFLSILLGFATLVATPVLLVLVALTFIGIGISLLLLIAYFLLAFLAYLYSGILLGALLARRFASREKVLWRDGVIGMLIFSLIGLIPIFGWAIVFLFTTFTAGALLILFFHFAFPRE